MRNRVREERLRLGLGQSELAERAGVTRQSVGAIEAGRHSPSVDAALRLASVLGVPVEKLFAPGSDGVDMSVTPIGAETGAAVAVGRVGDQRVYAPVRNLLSTLESWAMADGFMGDDGISTFSDIDESGLVIGGCDPLLGLAADVLARQRGPRIIPVHLSTGAAVAALSQGVVHGVVVHGPKGSLPKPPVGVRRWNFASWRVGVASPHRRAVSSVEQLAERRTRTAQREDGAGTQRALERALAGVGAVGLPGPKVDGHLDAARHVVAGLQAGITMEAAAAAYGLKFLPLETHHSELWLDANHHDHRGAVALISLLRDEALVKRAGRLPGYDIHRMGTEVLAS